MNKTRAFLFSLLLTFAGSPAVAYAEFTRQFIESVTAAVSFFVNPLIEHQGLSQVAPVNDNQSANQGLTRASTISTVATIKGTAKTTGALNTLTLYYYTTDEGNPSQVTGTTNDFNFSIPITLSATAGYLHYRIVAVDSTGNTGIWPAAGGFYSVDIQLPVITHQEFGRVSSIAKGVVAAGTVADNEGISSVSMYYKTDAESSFSTVSIPVPSNALTYNFNFDAPANLAQAKNVYYYFKAEDTNGNASYLPGNNQLFTAEVNTNASSTISSSGGIVTLSGENSGKGQTSLVIPPGALDANANIQITEVDPNNNTVMPSNARLALSGNSAVAVYSFSPDGLVFNKMVKVSLGYSDVNQDGLVDGTQVSEESLKVTWWDGFEWRIVGGEVDPVANTVNCEIKHFSVYAIVPVGALTANYYRPKEKIITPATVDNVNDFATFGNLQAGDSVKIFDVNGKKIRELKDTNVWDGKDENGTIVESGLYIYQIKAAGKTISGTIVVAR